MALINGSKLFIKMKKSLGNKRNKLGEGADSESGNEPDHIGDLTRAYGGFAESDIVKIFKGTDFAYRKIIVERPLRLRFTIDKNSIDRLQTEKPFIGLAKSKKKGAAGQAEIEAGQKLQAALVAGLTAVAHQPDVGADVSVVEHLVWQADDAFQIVILNQPAPDFRLTGFCRTREER